MYACPVCACFVFGFARRVFFFCFFFGRDGQVLFDFLEAAVDISLHLHVYRRMSVCVRVSLMSVFPRVYFVRAEFVQLLMRSSGVSACRGEGRAASEAGVKKSALDLSLEKLGASSLVVSRFSRQEQTSSSPSSSSSSSSTPVSSSSSSSSSSSCGGGGGGVLSHESGLSPSSSSSTVSSGPQRQSNDPWASAQTNPSVSSFFSSSQQASQVASSSSSSIRPSHGGGLQTGREKGPAGDRGGRESSSVSGRRNPTDFSSASSSSSASVREPHQRTEGEREEEGANHHQSLGRAGEGVSGVGGGSYLPSSSSSRVVFSARVLTQGTWPTDAQTTVTEVQFLPSPLLKEVSLFEKFYIQRHNGRILKWNLGQVLAASAPHHSPAIVFFFFLLLGSPTPHIHPVFILHFVLFLALSLFLAVCPCRFSLALSVWCPCLCGVQVEGSRCTPGLGCLSG